jgi:hypothetical protein
MQVPPPVATTIEVAPGQYGYVAASGMTHMPGLCRDFRVWGGWSAARPLQFDDMLLDVRTRQEWAAVRIHDLARCRRPVETREWTRAAGRTPALLLAERVGPRDSAPLLHAFGLQDADRTSHAVDWALTAHPRDYAGAQAAVRRMGIMYVLAALELLDFRALYTFVVALYKVPHLKGLALR